MCAGKTCHPRREIFSPNSEMGIVAVRRKAVLKHTQSKRWREV
jgi:hypothetical protein